jgi:hypothetical protein
MKGLTLIIWLSLSAFPALAQNAATTAAVPPLCPAAVGCRSAPAPLIGLGVPAAFAVGGVLLGARLLRRRPRLRR